MNFNFILTEECNWKCKYCEFPLITNQKSTTLDILKTHLPYIHDVMHKMASVGAVAYVNIQGGEVGLLSKEILQYYFQMIRYVTVVSTNGIFLERGYHKDELIRPFIETIHWHLSPDLNEKLTVNYEDETIPISRGIVHDDLDAIKRFIKLNEHIIFDYVEFEQDIRTPTRMDKEVYKKLYDFIYPLNNVTDYAKEVILKRLSELSNLRESCRDYNFGIGFDMINERIVHCQRDYHNYVSLSKENLDRRIKQFPKDFFSSSNCESCTRLYFGKFNGYSIVKGIESRRLYES